MYPVAQPKTEYYILRVTETDVWVTIGVYIMVGVFQTMLSEFVYVVSTVISNGAAAPH